MKLVKRYTSAFSANLAKGMLENEGIPAAVLNQNVNYSVGPVNTDLLSVELVVINNEDYQKALELIEQLEAE